ENVLDQAVLAGRIHALEDQQQRPAVLGVELLLHVFELFDAVVEQLLRVVLLEVETAAASRIVAGQPEAFRRINTTAPHGSIERFTVHSETFTSRLKSPAISQLSSPAKAGDPV